MNRISIAVALLAALMLVTPAAAEKIDNPNYKHWKQFKPGTMVVKTTTSVTGSNKTVMLMTTTLKSIDAEKAVLTNQTISKVMGKEYKQPATDMNIPAKIEKPKPVKPAETPKTPKPKIEKGKETLEIAGKKWECNWIKTTMKMQGGMTSVTTTWYNEKVPAQLVKSVSKTSSSAFSQESTTVVTKLVIK